MFHFIICDADDRFCRKEKQLILAFCAQWGIAAQVDIFHTGEEIIALGEKISAYEAIFVDVSLEKVNGIELGSWLNGAAPDLAIVFVSGHMSYALDGYKVGAVRYIMKDDEQFENSLEECLAYILRRSREDEAYYVTMTDAKIRVSVDKVLFVESKAHKIIYHLMKNRDTQQEYSMYGKLDDAQEALQRFGFCRVHQSFLVNMNYVQEVRRYEAVLLNGMDIRISKGRYKEVEAQFVRRKGTF